MIILGLALLKDKYSEILQCFPENYGATLESVQNSFSDTQICDILSLTRGHNEKILNCLIEQLKNKEDLLDFCANLEKIPDASASLKTIVEQLRKGASLQLSTEKALTCLALHVCIGNLLVFLTKLVLPYSLLK